MILPNGVRNAYEDVPEHVKGLAKRVQREKTRQPASIELWPTREALLKTHEAQLKLLSEGNVPIRNTILPRPYPPARWMVNDNTHQSKRLRDLLIGDRDTDAVLLLRTITNPYIYSNTVTVAEDENGDATRLTVCNLEDNVVDPIVTKGSVVAIKQPCWSELVEGGFHIRVDHPSDLVLLDPNSDMTPVEWRLQSMIDENKSAMQWKEEGDAMFLEKRFRNALVLYDRAIEKLSKNPNHEQMIDLYRKRCGVNIVLMRLDDAVKDLAEAISTHAASTSLLATTELKETTTIESWLRNNSSEDPLRISENIPRALKSLAARIKFDLGVSQSTPEYDFAVMSSYVGPFTLHIDAANYTCDTEVRSTPKHGRGLFAKKAFNPGDLICVEKAFALPGYNMQDRRTECLLYSLSDETAAPRPGAWLFKELVQKLRLNPSLRKNFFELDDGGYWKEHGWEVEAGEDIPVDVFRVELIRRYNCFSVPTRSSDLLFQDQNANPELRNGFWIHASYSNHSCLPNAVRTFIGDIRFMRAARRIEVGDEITTQYIAPEVDIDERQERYQATWGFRCDCELCVADGSIDRSVRAERSRLFTELRKMVMRVGEKGTTITSLKKIARSIRELEGLYTLSGSDQPDRYTELPRLALIHPTLFLTEAWRNMKNTNKTIEYAEKLLRNFGIFARVDGSTIAVSSSSGMINVETVRALRYLSEAFTIKDELVLAGKCMELAHSWFAIIIGTSVGADAFFK